VADNIFQLKSGISGRARSAVFAGEAAFAELTSLAMLANAEEGEGEMEEDNDEEEEEEDEEGKELGEADADADDEDVDDDITKCDA
jgi:hypothetical protein